MHITSTTDIWQLPLTRGASRHPAHGACAMDAISWLLYGELNDQPACVCPTIAAYVRTLNDDLDDVDRQRLRPYLVRLIDTLDPSTGYQRAVFLFHHAIREILPMAIDNHYWFPHRSFQRQCRSYEYGMSYIPRVSWYRLARRFPEASVQLYSELPLKTFIAGLLGDLRSRPSSLKPNIVSGLFAGLDGVLAIGRRSGDGPPHHLDEDHIRHSIQRFQTEAQFG